MESISWLENYLLNYSGAVFIVSHDRYFLDKVVTKVVEIEADRFSASREIILPSQRKKPVSETPSIRLISISREKSAIRRR